MARRASRIDGNQKQLDELALRVGAAIIHASEAPRLGCDRIYVRGQAYICEVKDGSLPPSERRLTEGELKCKAKVEAAGGRYWVIESDDDLLAMFGLKGTT